MADQYQGFNIPYLRRLLDDRGINIRNARNRTELTNLLVQDDLRRATVRNGATTTAGPGFINRPIVPRIEPVTPTQGVPIYILPVPIAQRLEYERPAAGPGSPPRYNDYPTSPYRAPTTGIDMATGLSLAYMKIVKAAFRRRNYPLFDQLPYPTDHKIITWGDPISRRKFHSNLQLIIMINNIQYKMNPVGYYMMMNDNNALSTLLTELGFSNLIADVDVCYNLLWYLNLAVHDPDLVTMSDRAVLSGMTDEKLLSLLGVEYNGPRDKAALLFAAVCGRSVHKPAIADIARYTKVRQYPASNTWYIARLLYDITNNQYQLISPYGPYVHIALQPGNMIEEIMARVRPENVEAFMRRYAMISAINVLRKNNVDLFMYFMNMISLYEPVLNRGPNVQSIPDIDVRLFTKEDIMEVLSPYTVDELVSFYEVKGNWLTHFELIARICENYNNEPHWAFRTRYCNNDDMFNVVEGELRADVDKNNVNDPTITYGVRGNYACYQASELAASFRADNNGIFQFFNPDWSPSTIKPGVERVFTIRSMQQLRQVLKDLPDDEKPATILRLQDKVNEGIIASQNTGILARKLRAEYDAMNVVSRRFVQLYLGWLFYYGMWMRFWKGPGEPWPLEWIQIQNDDRCILHVRDAHTIIQQLVGNRIIQSAAEEAGLQQWLEALPLIDYNFLTGESRLATGDVTTIKQILDAIKVGNFCLADGSDKVLRDAYFLITNILQINSDEGFYNFLVDTLKSLYNYERNVVGARLLNRMNEDPADLEVLLARQQVLTRPVPTLPPLPIRQVTDTNHIDPDLGKTIIFE